MRRALTPAMATRVSDTELHVAIPFVEGAYAITVPETITATLPVGVLTSNQSIVAIPSIRIQAMPGYATVSGPLLGTNESNLVEDALRSADAPLAFNLTLANETWLVGVGDASTYEHRQLTRRLLRGLTASGRWGVEPRAWEQVVRPAMLALEPPPVFRADEATLQFVVRAAAEQTERVQAAALSGARDGASAACEMAPSVHPRSCPE